jgi:type I restriction enzyme, R subunit
MTFYAGRVIAEPAMGNPTLVVITDRNDLDDQLFQTFARCKELLRQIPVQAKDREHLRELLQVAAGGVIFPTIQKFVPEEKGERFPVLTTRTNVVVVADEAHRSQYGFKATMEMKTGTISTGFAQHLRDGLPNASFIGFTGTPIDLEDKSTRAVFGDYISVYDIKRAVEDGATVPIYYEGRLAKLELQDHAKEILDDEFEELMEGEEDWKKDRLKSRWAALEAVVGEPKRVQLIAQDLLAHFDARQGRMRGKAMIVCMSRRICVELFEALRALRPELVTDDDLSGGLKVVMTGSASDPPEYQPHIRNKARLKSLANRFRDPDDPLQLVIVRDMWLTGFDAPCLHTMYIDKPMQGHSLMQAIARVNRVFRDKPGGLVVDYIGLADSLQKAIHIYTQSGGTGDTAIDVEDAVAVMQEKLEVCRGIFGPFTDHAGQKHPAFDVDAFVEGTPAMRLKLLGLAGEHIFALDDGRDRLIKAVLELSKAHALCAAHEAAKAIGDEVAFYEAVKATLVKSTVGSGKTQAEMDQAIRQMVSKAIAADGVVDLFDAVGLKKPDLAILSDEFLAEVQHLPHKNLAAELRQ